MIKSTNKYGIQITKPWSNEMYEHNDKVAQQMKAELLIQLKNSKTNDDEPKLREISKLICAYGFGDGFDFNDIYERTITELDNIQNYWLNDEFSDGVSAGIVNDVELEFIGY